VDFKKILIGVTEDWFALSHFQPLIRALREVAPDVVVATRSSGRMAEIEALGCRTIPFDFRRSSLNPIVEAATIRRFASLLRAERPDAVHLIALKPITLGAAAILLSPPPAVGVHLTGLGLLAVANDPKSRLMRTLAMRMTRSLLQRQRSQLFIENPDDLQALITAGADPGNHVTILGGAGVDPAHFTPCAVPAAGPEKNPIIAAYVGRMIRSKGIDDLVAAVRRLQADGVNLRLDLYGRIDADNPEAINHDDMLRWQAEGLVRWHGHIDDVRAVWQQSDIFVMATRGGEGLPRALLEAASSARPAVVTDVPGCRHFVRDGIEGLIVPPGDPIQLTAALTRLARDGALRTRMGNAARERVLSGFTETHVMDAVRAGYRGLASRSGNAR
jgi:glycosyltransferase involved in cell wall biosynthesis